MTKRVILIHGWEGYPEEGWRPWLKSELENKGFEVLVPSMPDTEKPKMLQWLNHLKKLITEPDENTYLVGHSLGCIASLRYIEQLPKDKKIGGAVLVAGFTSSLGYHELENFFETPINWNAILSHRGKYVAIHSDDDPYVSLHYADFFKKELSAEIKIEHHMKHISGSDNINKLPSALSAVLKISGK